MYLCRSRLSKTDSGVSALKGNIDQRVNQHAAQLTGMSAQVGDLSTRLHDLTGNLTRFTADTTTRLNTVNINLEDIRSVQARNSATAATSLNKTAAELSRRIAANAASLDSRHTSLDKKTESALQNYKAQTLAFVSNLNQQLENVGARVEQSRKQMADVDNFKTEMNGKFDLLRKEIVDSAEAITLELERNVASTILHVSTDVQQLRHFVLAIQLLFLHTFFLGGMCHQRKILQVFQL